MNPQVSFEVEGDLWATARFIDALKIPYIAPSLGGVESLIEMPAVQSYWSFGPEGRAKIGIKENLVSSRGGAPKYLGGSGAHRYFGNQMLWDKCLGQERRRKGGAAGSHTITQCMSCIPTASFIQSVPFE